jgi:DNA-binding NarL/FixJ family response regulator
VVGERKVLLLGTSRLFGDLVKGIVEPADDLRVVAEIAEADELAGALEATDADFVVASLDGEPPLTESFLDLLEQRPRLRVLVLAGEGRRGMLWELRPRRVPIGEVSPTTLLAALRSPGWRNGDG